MVISLFLFPTLLVCFIVNIYYNNNKDIMDLMK